MKIVFVSATGAKESGLLAIVNQFIKNIPHGEELFYYVFVDPFYRIQLEQTNIKYVRINTRSQLKRIFWDSYGLKKWSQKNSIKPDLIVSLQNTSINYSEEIPQIVYYHQLLPLVPYHWNIWNKDELKLYVFARTYPFFVKRYFNSNTYVVVQLPSTRNLFLKKFNVDEKKVTAIIPTVIINGTDCSNQLDWNQNEIHFIYPATFFPYKNHILLVKAMTLLRGRMKNGFDKIKIHLTLDDNKCMKLVKAIIRCNLHDTFVFEKTVEYNRLQSMYKQSHALLFPSQIESLGLPLIEAARAGIKVIANNRPFVLDAIGQYKGLTIVGEDAGEWADAIQACVLNGREIYTPYNYMSDDYDGWRSFFDLLVKIINK